jgi:hypothetical protein
MDEYLFQSRAWRLSTYACGAAMIGMAVYFAWIAIPMVPGIWFCGEALLSSTEHTQAMADLAQRAKEDPEAAALLHGFEESDAKLRDDRLRIAPATRVMAVWMLLWPAFFAAMGATWIGFPLAALRRRRRRTQEWLTARCGRPVEDRFSGGVAVVWVLYVIAFAAFLPALYFTLPSISEETGLPLLIYLCVYEPFAVLFLAWFMVGRVRRSLTHDWRLRLGAVPVEPGVPVAFELFRESGKPLGPGVRVELVGWKPRWNTAKDTMAATGSYRTRPIDGRVHFEPAPHPCLAIVGTLEIDSTNLTATAPAGRRRPRRMLPFLRIRQGWWRRCIMDIPAPALYVVQGCR